jgi:hypothetical protein
MPATVTAIRIWCCGTKITEPHTEGCEYIPGPDPTEVGHLYLLWCKLCEWQVPISKDNPLPFSDAKQRKTWAMEHQKGTGHAHFHTFTSNAHGTAWSTVMNLDSVGMF